jgi:hypothetical protein
MASKEIFAIPARYQIVTNETATQCGPHDARAYLKPLEKDPQVLKRLPE